MSNDNGKISVKQAMLFMIIVFCAPAIRYIPLYSTQQAKQAAWLAPLVALFFQIIYMLIWCKIIKKYGSKSFVDITKDILGKILGTIVLIIYFMWITFFLAYNVRIYAERILGSAMPGVSIYIVIGTMLFIVGYILKDGIIPLAKMAELFIILLGVIFLIYNILIIPKIQINNLLPITYKDAPSIFRASFPIMSLFGYNILIFMFNDNIEHKGEFKKSSIFTVLILIMISFLVIIVPVSVLGASVISDMPIPFLNTMMLISLFHVVERIESGIIMFWIVTDFMLVSIFIYSAIHMLKVSFKMPSIKSLTLIYILGTFFLSLIIAKSTAELQAFSENILTPTNIIMGFCLPIFIFFVGKVRKRV